MGAMSNALEVALLNATLRNIPYTSPSTVYLALYTNDPTDADLGTEVSGGGYVRQVVTFGVPVQVDGNGTSTNTIVVTFPIATANWGTITHFGIRSAATGGTLLFHGPINSPRSILSDDQLRFSIGDIEVDMG